jgi:hypothetical protein
MGADELIAGHINRCVNDGRSDEVALGVRSTDSNPASIEEDLATFRLCRSDEGSYTRFSMR